MRTPTARRESPSGGGVRSRLTYIAGTFLVTTAGLWVVARTGAGDVGAMTAGVLAAWTIQAAAVWTLVGALDAGGAVLRVWATGIGARVGGLVLAFVTGVATPLPAAELVLAYGVEILGLLLLEAAWLALRRRPGDGAGRTRANWNEGEDGVGAG